MVRSNGGEILAKDGTATTLDQAPALEAMQLLSDLRHKYGVSPKQSDLQGTNLNTLFEQGRLAMFETVATVVGRFREQAKFEWDVSRRAAGKAGVVEFLYAYPQVLYRGSKNPDAAWAALKWFEDDGMALLAREGFLQGTRVQAHHRAIFGAPSSKPPKKIGIFVTACEKLGRTGPSSTNWDEVANVMAQEVAPLWNGERTARDAAGAIKRAADPLVKAGKL